MKRKSSTAKGSAKASGSATGKKMAGSGTVNVTIGRLPDDHALEAGHLFVKTSMIELSLESLIWKLSKLDPLVGSLHTRRLQVRYKQQRIDELLPLSKAPQASAIWTEANKAICKVMEHRTWIAHAVPLSLGGAPLFMSTKKAKLGNLFGARPITIDEMRAANVEADQALELLEKLTTLV